MRLPAGVVLPVHGRRVRIRQTQLAVDAVLVLVNARPDAARQPPRPVRRLVHDIGQRIPFVEITNQRNEVLAGRVQGKGTCTVPVVGRAELKVRRRRFLRVLRRAPEAHLRHADPVRNSRERQQRVRAESQAIRVDRQLEGRCDQRHQRFPVQPQRRGMRPQQVERYPRHVLESLPVRRRGKTYVWIRRPRWTRPR